MKITNIGHFPVHISEKLCVESSILIFNMIEDDYIYDYAKNQVGPKGHFWKNRFPISQSSR